MFRLRRPSDAELADLASRAAADPFTYDAVGATAEDTWPTSYRHDRHAIDVGDASQFDSSVARLRAWQPHVGAGVLHAATGDIEPGTTVALAAPVLRGWVLATCRIVYV